MKIICPSCETKFAIGIDKLGPKGRKLKCSSCAHVWRAFDEDAPKPKTAKPEAKKPAPAPKPTPAPAPVAKAPATPDPAEENDQGAIDDMFAAAPDEENDQGAIDDMFAAAPDEENDQGAIDDMFAAAAPDEENDQGAIDDMFAAAAPDEENDQGAIDDMFAAAAPDEENDQGAIDDMFAAAPEEENDQSAVDDMFAAAPDEENDQSAVDDMFAAAPEEENDQSAVDDMFDTPLVADNAEAENAPQAASSTKEEFEKALPSQSAVYKKQTAPKAKSSYIYWGALAFAASLVMGIFFIGKSAIINYFPKSAAAYELYGLETNTLGLEFINISVRHQTQDGIEFLLVNGSIMNNSESTKILPKIRGYLVDRDDNSIFNWPIPIAKTSLAAGEIVSFKSGMKDPASSAQKVKFQFVLDKKLADN